MKNTFSTDFKPFKGFILRIPLLSNEDISNIPLVGDIDILETYFKTNAIFREAIYLASPQLFKACIKHVSGQENEKRKAEKLNRSLFKYLHRMSTRSTPFGIFASNSYGKITADTSLTLSPIEKSKRYSRVDMQLALDIIGKIEGIPVVKKHLLFYPNNSNYIIGNRLRYVECEISQRNRCHKLSAVEMNEFIDKILTKSTNGATISELIDSIVDDEISPAEAEEFMLDLINTQILVSELQPAVTGLVVEEQIIRILKRIKLNAYYPEPDIDRIITLMESVLKALNNLDKMGLGADSKEYTEIERLLILLDIPFDMNNLVQVDFTRSFEKLTVSEKVIEDILTGIEILQKFSNPRFTRSVNKFKEEFLERYDQNEIPLTVALDPETGIRYGAKGVYSGIPTPIIEDIFFSLGNQGQESKNLSSHQSFWFNAFVNAIKKGDHEIILDNEDLEKFDSKVSLLPNTLSVMVTLLGKHIVDGESKELIRFKKISGASAASLLGRFTHSHTDIFTHVKKITEYEANQCPDSIIAEIAHLPNSVAGNVIMRECIREYEIPYITKSGVVSEKQIPINDLNISIKNNKIVLRSKKYNKEVIPRLTTAHNFLFNTLPIYQFLCDIQTQNCITELEIDFDFIARASFIPRIRYKNLILFPATWTFENIQLVEILEDKDFSRQKHLLYTLLATHSLSKKFILLDHDNEIIMDVTTDIGVRYFLNVIKSKQVIKVIEYIENRCPFTDTNNCRTYVNEFIFSFYRKIVENPKADNSSSAKKIAYSGVIQRTFIPGEEWLYMKYYTNYHSFDSILRTAVTSAIEILKNNNLISQWFFLRYADPHPHLRIRFNITDGNNEVLKLLSISMKDLIKNGIIWKVQSDTYQREIERYGAHMIKTSEKLFCYDSEAILKLLNLLNEKPSVGKYRWLIGLKNMDNLINIIISDPKEKLSFINSQQIAFMKEFNSSSISRKQISAQYRANSKIIEQFLNRDELVFPGSEEINQILNERDLIITNELNLSANEDTKNLFYSYIHMSINRLFNAQQRQYEYILYDFLNTFYKSQQFKSMKYIQ